MLSIGHGEGLLPVPRSASTASSVVMMPTRSTSCELMPRNSAIRRIPCRSCVSTPRTSIRCSRAWGPRNTPPAGISQQV